MELELITKNNHTEVLDSVISNIRDLIVQKNMEPGDKLPSERVLSEKFEVTRSITREAIKKLEYYGLLKSIPQSGTFVENIGLVAIDRMTDYILNLGESSFKSLVETRILLELKTTSLAAYRRSEEDLINIKEASDSYAHKVLKGEDSVQEDLLFHLAIAKASGNPTLNAMMLTITPEIIMNFEKHHVCDTKKTISVIQEHIDIYEAIKNKNPQEAHQKMEDHFGLLYEYCYNGKVV